MKKRLYLIILLSGFLLTTLPVNGQENTYRQIYNQAENDYNIGRIDQSLALLQGDFSV